MKYYTFEGASGEQQVEHDIPADMLDEANAAREHMLDTISAFDDDLAMMFLEGEDISEAMVKKAIRAGVIK
jgi:elongation factor G